MSINHRLSISGGFNRKNSGKSFIVFKPFTNYKLVGVLGVEPRTSSLSGTRSNQLSYTPSFPLKSCLRRRLRRLTLTCVKASGTFRGPRSPFFRAAFAVLKTASKVGFIKYLKSCLRRRLRRLTLTCVKASGTFRGPRSTVFRAAALYSNLRVRSFFYSHQAYA